MTQPAQPPAVVATITGKDLLDRLDALTTSFNTLSRKLDDVPAKVNDHETRIRDLEARKVITWPAALALCTVVLTALGVVAAFLAVH